MTPISRREAISALGSVALALALPKHVYANAHAASAGDTFPHPDPRPGITAANVLADDRLPDRKRVRDAFRAAREFPELFDGVYCICDCSDQHRSLLACFESDQPTGCRPCQEQAEFVARHARDGKNLTQIRTAIDERWAGKRRHH